jgi:hypothetical protein
MEAMIERELKVSELQPGMTVRVWKEGRPTLEMEVVAIHERAVAFYPFGHKLLGFLAARTGPDLEQITDDANLRMRIFAL